MGRTAGATELRLWGRRAYFGRWAAIIILLVPATAMHLADGQTSPAAADGSPAYRNAGLMTPAYVCTQDLALALTASSAELASRRAEVVRRQGELRLVELGLSSMISVTSGVEVGANLQRSEEAAWSPSLQMDAGLRYRYDEVALIRARVALVTAIRRADAQQRADVLTALISLSRLRAADRLAAQTGHAASEAEALATSVRESAVRAYATSAEAHGAAVDEATETDRTSAALAATATGGALAEAALQSAAITAAAPDVALNIRELDLAAARARAAATGRQSDADAARAQLNRLGIPPAAAYAGTGHVGAAHHGPAGCLTLEHAPMNRAGSPALPEPPALGGHARQLLLHALELATAQQRRASLGPVRDLSMTAHYQEGGARVLAELELDGGRPTAGVNVRWRETAAHNWGVGVTATIRLDDSMGATLESARAQVASAQTEILAFDGAFDSLVTAELAAVGTAWLQLAFAVEAVSIARGRLALAVEERDVTRSEQVLNRSIDALEREYQAYLRALARYLDQFDLPWHALMATETGTAD